MTAPIRSMPELLAALRDSVHERGVSYQTIDEIGGLPDRYTSKVLAPDPSKNMGITSFGDILGAVGKAVMLVDDPEQMARVQGRWSPRKRPLKPPRCASALGIPIGMPEMLELQPQNRNPEYMKLIGKRGASKAGKASAKRRAKTMGKRARQRAASHAARARWSKEKRV